MVPQPLRAHGLAVQLQDVPLPLWAFYAGAAAALVLSFLLLALLRRRSVVAGQPRAAPTWIARVADARAVRLVARGLGIAWLALALATGLLGSADASENPLPNLVFVLGWIGIPVAALLLGRGALLLHPVAAVARLGGLREETETPLPRAWGLWPAWLGLLVFTWLELVYPSAADVQLLVALLIAWVAGGVVVAARVGIRDWLTRVDPFGAYAQLLSSLSPWERRTSDRRLGVRMPLLGPNRSVAPAPGLVPLVTLLVGSVSYDGLSRTGWWQERVTLASAQLGSAGGGEDAARLLFGTFGFASLLLLAWGAFELAAWASGRVGALRTERLRTAAWFAPSLLPIALAYVVAHYFAFFVVQVQDLVRHASDPLGTGADLLGTRHLAAGDYWRPSGTLTWLVQAGAIVTGHVAGLLLAHDRAIELAPRVSDGSVDVAAAVRSQLPMLLLMLLYTVAGLYFLSEGLS